MSIKISKKELRRLGEYHEGYYFTGNCYSYESIVNHLTQLAWRTEKGSKTKNSKRIKELKKYLINDTNKKYFNSLKDIVEKIENIKHDSYSMDQLYYSAGLYGNSGQLHTLKLFNKENIVAMFYLYY